MEGPRATRREEFGQVMELVDRVFRLSVKMPPTMQQEFPLLFHEANLENMRIVLEDGKPVSHVGIYEATAYLYGCPIRVGLIGAVCTHPDYRGRGLATTVLKDAMRKMGEDGVTVVLVSGIRGLYDRLGCAVAGRVHPFTIQPRDVELIQRQGFELRPFEDTATAHLARIHQGEPVRFQRRLGEFRAFLRSLGLDSAGEVHPRHTFTVSDGTEPLAYIVAQIPRDASKSDSTVVEYGGSRRAVAAALKLLIQQYGLKGLQTVVPTHDFELLSILKHVGLALPKTTHFGGTVRVLNLHSLISQLEPYLSERVDVGMGGGFDVREDAGRFVLSLNHERFVLRDERDLTRLMFGVPESVGPRHEQYVPRSPIAPTQGRLADALRRVFPLPTIVYGLNYT